MVISHSKKRVFIASLITIVVLVSFALFLAPLIIPKTIAQLMLPPEYSNSILVSETSMLGTSKRGLGTAAWVGEERAYETTDNLETVVSFMETEMPGFHKFQGTSQKIGMPEMNYIGFSNGRCYNVNLVQALEHYFRKLDWSAFYFPCVSVEIYPNDWCSCTSIKMSYRRFTIR